VGIIRRRKQTDYEVRAGDVDDAVVADAADSIGTSLSTVLAEPPKLAGDDLEPALGFGPGVFRFAIDVDDVASDDSQWSGTFLARVADESALRREMAWLDAALRGTFPAHEPALRAAEHGVMLWREPPGVTLTECMLVEMAHVPRFLAALGELHAQLHALPAGGLADSDDTNQDQPVLANRANTDEIRSALADELDWLTRNRPATGDGVVCHGDFNSAYVYMEPKDTDTALVVNWSSAHLAGPEDDVAGAMTAFWFSPFYLDNVVYRKALTMARDSLIDAYLNAYRETAEQPLDDDALRYWQAFHICALATDVAHIVHHGSRHAWDPIVNVIRPERTLSDLRGRFRELTS
jgi:Phosphotransferase enzyme family